MAVCRWGWRTLPTILATPPTAWAGQREPYSSEVSFALHCDANPIYIFPEKELHGLSLNFHIHVSVSNLYIPRIGPHIFLQQNRQIHRGNTYINPSQTHECGNWDCGRAIPLVGIFVFEFSALVLCSVHTNKNPTSSLKALSSQKRGRSRGVLFEPL
jgi:hypothetical protein